MSVLPQDYKIGLIKELETSQDTKQLYHKIVNAPFLQLIAPSFDIGTIVLLISNKSSGFIERVALSKTAASEGAVNASVLPFDAIKIPIDYIDSAHVKALKSMKPKVLTDWYDMFRPALTADQSRDNQHSAGITTSVVYPYNAGSMKGTIIYSLYVEPSEITEDANKFFKWYSELVGLTLDSLNTANS